MGDGAVAIQLGPTESPEGHAFASVDNYTGDLALMNYQLQDVRSLIRSVVANDQPIAPHKLFEWEVHGLQRRTVICDPGRIVTPLDFHIVGFFGDRRAGVDLSRLEFYEHRLIEDLRDHPGIVSYSSMELVHNYWANLVVHSALDDRERWNHGENHRNAVDELSHIVYRSVRIHRAQLVGGVVGPNTVLIEFTSYWDYEATPTWKAVRDLPGGLSINPQEPSP
ncbi:MAG: hypothetical protein ACR2P0_14015 [Acidimicrobiales bacterium]